MSSPACLSFSRAARRYRDHAHVQAAMAEWLAEWAPVERIGEALEIGAGTGVFTRRVLPWPGRYVASDLSPQMCEEGRRQHPQIEWSIAGAEVPLEGPWDWIFSSSTLQWMEEPVSVFSNWRHALRPGGRLVAGLFVKGSLPELRSLTGDWSPLTWRPTAEWEDAIRSSGLKLRRSETREVVFHYPSALEMLRGLHRVGASPIRRYSARDLREVMARYDAQFRKEGQVRATWNFCRLEASR